jgi:AcrR family transcriptional regulator
VVVKAEPHRRGSKVVDAILAATIEELARVGFAGLSVEDVSARAGVNKTTVYRRWPTKIELVLAALTAGAEGGGEEPDTGDVRSDLLVFMRDSRDRLSTPVGRGTFVALLADEPQVATVAAQLRALGDTRMRRIVKRAVARGELPRGLDMDLFGELIFGALQLRLLFRRDVPASDEYLERVIDAAVVGVNAPRARKAR